MPNATKDQNVIVKSSSALVVSENNTVYYSKLFTFNSTLIFGHDNHRTSCEPVETDEFSILSLEDFPKRNTEEALATLGSTNNGHDADLLSDWSFLVNSSKCNESNSSRPASTGEPESLRTLSSPHHVIQRCRSLDYTPINEIATVTKPSSKRLGPKKSETSSTGALFKQLKRKKKKRHSSSTSKPVHEVVLGAKETALLAESESLELHRDVYVNDLEKLDSFWRENKRKLNKALELYDMHGLSAIHLACRLGRLQYLDLFLVMASTRHFKARTRDQDALGWSILDETVILGNRKYIKLVYLILQYHQHKRLEERKEAISRSLAQTMDFSLTIKWSFRSWIPLLSRYLPSDTCVLYKRGNKVRLDSTLLNFVQNSWKRGNISVIYNPDEYGGENFVFVVPSKQQFSISSIDKPLKPEELWREVNSLLSNDVIVTKMSTKNVTYTPVKRFITRASKVNKIGKYSATYYHWSGMVLKITKRRDHLSQEQISKNKHVLSDFYTGSVIPGLSGESSGRTRVPDLIPPPTPDGSFEDYILGNTTVGRPMKLKSQTKPFKGAVAMCDEFPLSIEKLCEILQLFSNFRLFEKLRTFLMRGMPPGFPVYVEIPVFPTVQGQIFMEDFQSTLPHCANTDQFFLVPDGYEKVEDLDVS